MRVHMYLDQAGCEGLLFNSMGFIAEIEQQFLVILDHHCTPVSPTKCYCYLLAAQWEQHFFRDSRSALHSSKSALMLLLSSLLPKWFTFMYFGDALLSNS